MSAVINLSLEMQLARSCAQGLRSAAAACSPPQNVLKARLLLSADQRTRSQGSPRRPWSASRYWMGRYVSVLLKCRRGTGWKNRTSATRAAITRAQRARRRGVMSASEYVRALDLLFL